ncbi:hypothetical protein HY792_00685 [Candidatus Desantisbacteria bacterium]|nr:hypothetical protein [Candidatus Desantisbacteria bacterium]
MSNSMVLKERVLVEIEELSNSKIKEVLDFVGYLKTWGKTEKGSKLVAKLAPENDPILKFIGSVSHGFLAKNIDNDLYGG